MNCVNPIDPAILADYWIAMLSPPDQDAVEEHLMGCSQCSAMLTEMVALIDGVRQLAREGSLRMIISDGVLKRAREEGLTVREYAPPKGGSVQCTVTPQDDLLIGRFVADIKAAKQIDLCFFDLNGNELTRMTDIPFRSGPVEIVMQESITFAKGSPDMVMIARLLARDETNEERLLGEYTFNHTRSMPGKAAW